MQSVAPIDPLDKSNAGAPRARPTVAVVINTYNQSHYLHAAIRSVLNQSSPADEIIVVDDGSRDRPDLVVAAHPGIAYIRQDNQGLSASRNTGLAAARADMIVFLDADDRLLPSTLARGLARHREVPGCAFVYGSYHNITSDGAVLGPARYSPAGEHPYLDLLRRNTIGMHAAVMYRRETLARHHGFDIGLRRCEDYDVYLKLTRSEQVASYPDVVAEYRRHDANMSHDHPGMLAAALQVLDRQEAGIRDTNEREALTEGRRLWKGYFAMRAWMLSLATSKGRSPFERYPKAAMAVIKMTPSDGVLVMFATVRNYAKTRLPAGFIRLAKRLRPGASFGRVNLGDLSRTHPVSDQFGFDRGKPIDRYYVEGFLDRQRVDIKGRTLEIGDDSYTRQFGGAQVQQADVLHVNADNPHATIVGDISQAETLPVDAFDCLVLTQTLHLIYDMPAAVRAMHRALKPGGVVLLTVPGISQIDRGEWGSTWFWALTPAAATRLFADVFGAANISVESHGNVYAATTFLQGLALEEVDRRKLDVVDLAYPVIVTVRAQKQA